MCSFSSSSLTRHTRKPFPIFLFISRTRTQHTLSHCPSFHFTLVLSFKYLSGKRRKESTHLLFGCRKSSLNAMRTNCKWRGRERGREVERLGLSNNRALQHLLFLFLIPFSLSINLSIGLSIYLYIYLYICVSIYLSH